MESIEAALMRYDVFIASPNGNEVENPVVQTYDSACSNVLLDIPSHWVW